MKTQKNKKEKKEMAPVLQSLKEYLENHFMDEILEEVKAAMSLGAVSGLDIDCKGEEVVIDSRTATLLRAEAWRVDRTNLIADCKLRFKFGIVKDGMIPRFLVRFVNFSLNITLDHGITVHKGLQNLSTAPHPEHQLPKLTKYLVPVLTYDEMETLVLDMLRKYLGEEAKLTDRENGARQLAEAMGLKIMNASLYKSKATAAVLYLKEGPARVLRPDARDEEDYEDITVPEKTILLNDQRQFLGDVDGDIYHECGHYEWHSMFYELQELHASDLRLLKYEETDELEASLPAVKDVAWVEKQASFVGIAAMLPRPVFAPLVKKYWIEVMNTQGNLGHRIGSVICKIASEKQKSRAIIKRRMITLGSVAAKGALNFVDDRYICDFAFNPEQLHAGETFVITRGQFTKVYEQEERFRELINTHEFIYADGHVCCNQPQFVRKTQNGYMLTSWALEHVDECCLKFSKSYEYSPQQYRIGVLHSDQDYNECYLMIHALDIAGMPDEELMDKNLEYLDELPKRPSKALSKLIKDRLNTQRALAAASGLSEATISRMCKEDDYDYSIQDVTRLIVGLQLPPPLSALFLDMTRFTRTVMVKYLRYQCIIDCMFMEDIDTVVEAHPKMFDN